MNAMDREDNRMDSEQYYKLYKNLGSHMAKKGNEQGTRFSVWAPNARAVSVIGDFNDWTPKVHQMERQGVQGIFTCFISDVQEGNLYKYCIETQTGELLYKADPFANWSELRPGTASRVTDLDKFKWTDEVWMESRREWDYKRSPISVYEVHIGSWKKHSNLQGADAFYNYREFAVEATRYVKEMGYTHIELMGIAEHPYDGSWGYQVTGYYAPTSRYGTPQDFAYMIDYFHQNHIGVILDWVPAHFSKDEHGLSCFDGTSLYEYEDPKRGEHTEWGTKIFDYGKAEVKCFLISNALFWIEQFHIDGLRVDAVASMVYQDYGHQYEEPCVTSSEHNYNLEAIAVLRELNTLVCDRNPGVMMIAEESTTFPKVTGPVKEGGLGFDLKWNMGWMHDFTQYVKLEPSFRKVAHHHMTFAMSYAHSEEYMLVLSHDEVVHLKRSMLSKMPGELHEKFANLKVAYAFMMGHAGKKLLFMGQDFGQLEEWNEAKELDWHLLSEDIHADMQTFTKKLLQLYKNHRAMYESDTLGEGFEWVNADDCERSIYSFMRHSKDQKKHLLFVCNFSPIARQDYRIGVSTKTEYKLLIHSDEMQEKPLIYKAEKLACDGRPFSFSYNLPSYGVAIFEF